MTVALPDELWLRVFQLGHFSLRQALYVRAVCCKWRDLCKLLVVEGDHPEDDVVLQTIPSIGGVLDFPGPAMFGGLKVLTVTVLPNVRIRPFGINANKLETIDVFFAAPPQNDSWSLADIRSIFRSCVNLKTCRLLGMNINKSSQAEPVLTPPRLTVLRLMAASRAGTFQWSLNKWQGLHTLTALSLSNWNGRSAVWQDTLQNMAVLKQFSVSNCPRFDNGACRVLFERCLRLEYVNISDTLGIVSPVIILAGAGNLKNLQFLRLERDGHLLSAVPISNFHLSLMSGTNASGSPLFPALTKLMLRGYRVCPANLMEFATKLALLRTLGIDYNLVLLDGLKKCFRAKRPDVRITAYINAVDI